MKKVVYVLILLLVVVSGLVIANREIKNETPQKTSPKPVKWADSTEGKKVHASGEKIMKYIKDSTNMEAVVTSLSPAPSMCGFGVVIRVKGEEYHLNFVPDRSDQSLTRFLKYAKQLNTLKVNDKIVVRSYNALLYLPSDPLPIILGDYLERNNKIIFKRDIREDGSEIIARLTPSIYIFK